MQLATCEVRLLGDIANSVPKSNVTPAEAAILRAIHGPDSVVRVKVTGTQTRPHKDEYERLASIYGNTSVDDGVKIFYKVFPETFDPKLPVNFKDIGMSVVEDAAAPVPNIPDEEEPSLELEEVPAKGSKSK